MESRDRLLEYGIAAGKIQVCGIPIDGEFKTKTNRVNARLQLGLDLDAPVVMVMG